MLPTKPVIAPFQNVTRLTRPKSKPPPAPPTSSPESAVVTASVFHPAELPDKTTEATAKATSANMIAPAAIQTHRGSEASFITSV